jgi:hypothetical protein
MPTHGSRNIVSPALRNPFAGHAWMAQATSPSASTGTPMASNGAHTIWS